MIVDGLSTIVSNKGGEADVHGLGKCGNNDVINA